jgi:small subunit ribosomal protein S4
MVKKAYPPGLRRKRRVRGFSEYGKELNEKQKLKNWYNLKERQFRKYVKGVLQKRGKVEDEALLLIETLESRLDNVVFRLGFAKSRTQAKQLVSHGHFLVNGKSIDAPSYPVKKGDIITLKPQKIQKGIFKNLKNLLKKYKPPAWLELNVEKLEGKVVGEPSLEEAAPPVEISAIFEYYSR